MNEKVKKMLEKNIAPVVNGTSVRTSPVRLSFARLFTPSSFDGGEEKYSTSLLIRKEDKALVEALKSTALEVAKTKWGEKLPKFKNPFIKDGDESEDATTHGHYVIRASSKKAPEVLRVKGGKLVEVKENEIKSGDWVLATINIFPYDMTANKGISAYLNNILLLAEDEALGGASRSGVDDFKDLAGDTDLEGDNAIDDLI